MRIHALSDNANRPKLYLLRAIIGFTLYLLFVPALLFLAAGTMNWIMGWIYVVLLLGSTLGSRFIAWRKHPDVLRERARFAEAEGAKSWDRLLVVIVGLLGPMVLMIVAGLDHRFSWSSTIPLFGQIIAAVLVAIGYGLAVWAMAVNPFFSAVVRIQKDRGQVVVSSGPYRYVRHPSYAGALIASLALPFMLEAMWTLVPALAIVIALIIRTALEDKMLMKEMDGYAAYSAKTPWRLFPAIW